MAFLDDECGDLGLIFDKFNELGDEYRIVFLLGIKCEEKNGGEPIDGDMLEAFEASTAAMEEAAVFVSEGGGFEEGGEHPRQRLALSFVIGRSRCAEHDVGVLRPSVLILFYCFFESFDELGTKFLLLGDVGFPVGAGSEKVVEFHFIQLLTAGGEILAQ